MFDVVKNAYIKFANNIEHEISIAMKQIALVNNN